MDNAPEKDTTTPQPEAETLPAAKPEPSPLPPVDKPTEEFPEAANSGGNFPVAAPSVDLFPESAPVPPDLASAVAAPPAATPPDEKPAKRGRGRPKIHGKYSKDGAPPEQTQDGGTAQTPQPDFSDIVGNLGAQTPAAATMPTASTNYRKIAEQFFDMGTGLLTGFVGPEWQPRDKDERTAVVIPLAEVLKTKQITDLPPNVALLLAVVMYAGPRFGQPATQSKVKALWGRAKNGWAWVKVRIIGPIWLKLFKR